MSHDDIPIFTFQELSEMEWEETMSSSSTAEPGQSQLQRNILQLIEEGEEVEDLSEKTVNLRAQVQTQDDDFTDCHYDPNLQQWSDYTDSDDSDHWSEEDDYGSGCDIGTSTDEEDDLEKLNDGTDNENLNTTVQNQNILMEEGITTEQELEDPVDENIDPVEGSLMFTEQDINNQTIIKLTFVTDDDLQDDKRKMWMVPMRGGDGKRNSTYIYGYTKKEEVRLALFAILYKIRQKLHNPLNRNISCCNYWEKFDEGEFFRSDEGIWLDISANSIFSAEQTRFALRKDYNGLGSRRPLASCKRLQPHNHILLAAVQRAKAKFNELPEVAKPDFDMKTVPQLRKTMYKCQTCHMQFSSRQSHDRHTKTHLQRTMIRCEDCNVVFRQNPAFRRHIKYCNIRLSNTSKTDSKTCPICQLILSSKRHLKNHLSIHTPCVMHECSDCGIKFRSRFAFSAHQNVCRIKHPHLLEQEPTTPNYLKCSICHISFSSKYETLRHEKAAHIPYEMKKCGTCVAEFSTTTSLNFHSPRCINRQSNDTVPNTHRKYTCDICRDSFRSADLLRRHHKTHARAKATRFICKHCDVSFNQEKSLIRHRNDCTKKNPQYKCDICHTIFPTWKYFKQHENVHTPWPVFHCALCNISFQQKKTCIDHLAFCNQRPGNMNQSDVQNEIPPTANSDIIMETSNLNEQMIQQFVADIHPLNNTKTRIETNKQNFLPDTDDLVITHESNELVVQTNTQCNESNITTIDNFNAAGNLNEQISQTSDPNSISEDIRDRIDMGFRLISEVIRKLPKGQHPELTYFNQEWVNLVDMIMHRNIQHHVNAVDNLQMSQINDPTSISETNKNQIDMGFNLFREVFRKLPKAQHPELTYIYKKRFDLFDVKIQKNIRDLGFS